MKLLTFFFTLLFLTLQCHAEIYEIIDKNGRKTFTDKPPANQPGAQPIKAKNNTNNTWQNNNVQQQNQKFFNELKAKQDTTEAATKADEDYQAALQEQKQINIKAAEKGLQQAQEVKAGDFLNNKKGGMHYTPQYHNRVNQAKGALEQAKTTE